MQSLYYNSNFLNFYLLVMTFRNWYNETKFKRAGIWPEIRIALKRDYRIAGRTEPPNFRCSLVIWSGPVAFFNERE